MELDSVKKIRTANFVLTVVSLVLLIVGLLALVLLAANAARGADANTRKFLVRMAWVATALMGLALIMLVWVILRRLRSRFEPSGRHAPTPYVDAWAEAGKRIQVETEEDDDQPEEDRDDADRPGSA